MFNLEQAIADWRQKMLAAGIETPVPLEELELHLREEMASLRHSGLNEEESFWLACRRIGQPQPLAAEFAQVDPATIWRERLAWMTISLVVSYVFMTWKDILATWLNPTSYGWIELVYLIPLIVLIGLVVMIRRGRVPNPGYLESMASRKTTWGLFAVLTVTVLAAYFRGNNLPSGDDGIGGLLTLGYNIGLVFSWMSNAVWPSVMVLMLLLTLKRNRKISITTTQADIMAGETK
jgi:hypothetical protein